MRAYRRMLDYLAIHTTSDDTSGAAPSTKCQFDLAHLLVKELLSLGVEDAHCDEKCYVYGHIPPTPGYEDATRIGFIAHMDTAPDFSGENVHPIIHENYDGGDIPLGDSGRVLRVADFPHLARLRGRTLITTDGTTLLGADDKAGIAEIMTLICRLRDENIPHGGISIAFTPDEEVGRGAESFDIDKFDADFAYTMDGGEENQIEYENFNAAAAVFDITGVSVHPGTAKDTMVNALLLAMEINGALPAFDTPAHTEGREGFYHLSEMSGDVSSAHMEYIVRDHDAESYQRRLAALRHIEKLMNEKYGEGAVKLSVREQYRNMVEKVRPHSHLIDIARDAMISQGLTPDFSPIRGGTDGAQLSFMGLVCPNLGTGGYAYHGPFEHITAEGMDIAVDVMISIVRQYSNRTEKRG